MSSALCIVNARSYCGREGPVTPCTKRAKNPKISHGRTRKRCDCSTNSDKIDVTSTYNDKNITHNVGFCLGSVFRVAVNHCRKFTETEVFFVIITPFS